MSELREQFEKGYEDERAVSDVPTFNPDYVMWLESKLSDAKAEIKRIELREAGYNCADKLTECRNQYNILESKNKELIEEIKMYENLLSSKNLDITLMRTESYDEMSHFFNYCPWCGEPKGRRHKIYCERGDAIREQLRKAKEYSKNH